LSWYGPLPFARTSSAQAAISSGCINSAPQAPSPPACITAIERAGADAPAIGASRIGTSSPKRRQNESTRARMADISYLASSRFEALTIMRARAWGRGPATPTREGTPAGVERVPESHLGRARGRRARQWRDWPPPLAESADVIVGFVRASSLRCSALRGLTRASSTADSWTSASLLCVPGRAIGSTSRLSSAVALAYAGHLVKGRLGFLAALQLPPTRALGAAHSQPSRDAHRAWVARLDKRQSSLLSRKFTSAPARHSEPSWTPTLLERLFQLDEQGLNGYEMAQELGWHATRRVRCGLAAG
jgi:hypothetical protein